MTLTLAWPPSVNTYYRHVGHKTLISAAGRAYRANVLASVTEQGTPRTKGRVRVTAIAHPPDKRRRDLDNLWKSLLDSLTHALVIEDDSLIDDLRITRAEPQKPGRIILTIEAIA